jgi:hypothetical protein
MKLEGVCFLQKTGGVGFTNGRTKREIFDKNIIWRSLFKGILYLKL